MRLKNIKGAEEKVSESPYVINNPKEVEKLFDNNNPIYVEIGMGKGKFIIENALKYPNINFIGIEKYASVMVRAVTSLSQLDLPNLKLIKIDALEIDQVFNHEIDQIFLNFSDPWPKKRHTNRRLTSPIFLEKYDKISRKSAHIVMKTDNRKLFEYSITSLNNYGYTINDLSLNLYGDEHHNNIATEYEEKFVAKGELIYMIDVVKTRHI